MKDRIIARANARIHAAFEDRAPLVIQHCAPLWERFFQDRHAQTALSFLNSVPHEGWTLSVEGDAPTLRHPALTSLSPESVAWLRALQPWRKGPLAIADTLIDAEWRSEQKWQRIQPLLPDAIDGPVIDIGSNNGYYGHRLQSVVDAPILGVEPTPLYIAQALCFEGLAAQTPVTTLPAGLDVLVHLRRDAELILLMGILYHHSDPLSVLKLCANALRAGGTLLVETIVIAGEGSQALFVPGKYTGAKGFYWLPTLECLHSWLRRAGLRVVDALDPTPTQADEQRVTDWRGGDASLAEGLDANDPSRTIEGHPAPLRVALRCTLT